MRLDVIVLFAPESTRTPSPLKLRILSARMVLPVEASVRPLVWQLPALPAFVPSSTTPDWLVPSMMTASVIGGRAAGGWMTYGPLPGRAKRISSGVEPLLSLGRALAALMASRNEHCPKVHAVLVTLMMAVLTVKRGPG